MKLSPFICQLLATQCGRDLRYSADCDFLALDIESKTGEHIGVNTMKRLLGFINDERSPRMSTLDVIARYLGYEHWEALRLSDENCSNSVFDDRAELLASSLVVGQQVAISYPPNRRLTIEYTGDNHFQVVQSEHSKLLAGDLLTLTHIVKGYPLLVSDVTRDGLSLGSFTAGKSQGIDFELIHE
jgi:hypothetical protein